MTATVIPEFIGIDVSKCQLDVCGRQLPHHFSNDQEGVNKLVLALKGTNSPHVICENTGGYERRLVKALQKEAIRVTHVNPLQIRNFAKSGGYLEKTDAIDAKVIQLFGEKWRPDASNVRSDAEEALLERVNERTHLINQRTMELARREHLEAKESLRRSKARIDLIEAQVEDFDKLIEKAIEEDETLSSKASLLSPIKGFGPTTISSFLAYMPELGHLNDRKACKLAGVAPINHDSGVMRGHKHIKGGRPNIRRVIYMAALVAIQHNAILKEFYIRLKKAGKAPKVIITAVMRKLIILANRKLKNA